MIICVSYTIVIIVINQLIANYVAPFCMSYQRNCPNWILFWVNPRQSKPLAAVKSPETVENPGSLRRKSCRTATNLALMALMAAAVAVSGPKSPVAKGLSAAASDQPLWHPKMASLVNPY
jgi:predicted PurR-regulated permease PerM